jgi:hypothetical protein
MASDPKLHRRSLRLDGHDHTVLSVRPLDPERFATNNFHDTWHVLSDVAGAQLLGRICWAMAFQRNRGTFALVDHTNLVPNPFDADPSNPIVIANADLGVPSRQALTQLKARLPFRTKPDGTMKVSTFSIEPFLNGERNLHQEHLDVGLVKRLKPMISIERINGIIVMSATSATLEEWGVSLCQLGTRMWTGMDYTDLDWGVNQGEVQIFEHFADMVPPAIAARAQLFPGRAHEELLLDDRAAMHAHMDSLRAKLTSEAAASTSPPASIGE